VGAPAARHRERGARRDLAAQHLLREALDGGVQPARLLVPCAAQATVDLAQPVGALEQARRGLVHVHDRAEHVEHQDGDRNRVERALGALSPGAQRAEVFLYPQRDVEVGDQVRKQLEVVGIEVLVPVGFDNEVHEALLHWACPEPDVSDRAQPGLQFGEHGVHQLRSWGFRVPARDRPPPASASRGDRSPAAAGGQPARRGACARRARECGSRRRTVSLDRSVTSAAGTDPSR
jgi:hypothetical protein